MPDRWLTGAMAVLCLLPASPLPAQARGGQASVRGTVVSSADEPVSLARIDLRARGDSVTRGSTESTETGRFRFDGVAPGVYVLVIRRIGYRMAQTIEFTVEGIQERDLGRIRLEALALELEPVVVTVERPDVEYQADRTSFLVEALAGTPDAAVSDALRNVPDVTIEFDGTVRVRGATPTIFINGQPAPFNGTSLAGFLEQFPASQIERIEVLDAPPARFSAEGTGGIINIVLKQGVNLGVNGAIHASGGTRGQRAGGGRLTVQRGPWTLNSNLNARWTDSERSDLTLRQNLSATPTTYLRQDAAVASSSRGGGMFLDLRRNLSGRSRLSLRTNANLSANASHGRTDIEHLDADQLPTLWYDRRTRNHSDGLGGQGAVTYTYSWQPQRHQLELQLSGQVEDSDSEVREKVEALEEFYGQPGLPWWLTHRNRAERTTGYSLEANYVRPLPGQGRLDVGISHRFSDSRESQETARFILPTADAADQSDLREVSRLDRTSSVWITVNRRVGRIGVMVGARGEGMNRTVALPDGTPFARRDATFFPSANLTWNPRQRLNLRLGYSQRVGRPGVNQLDPTDRSTDPLNRSVGNPDLRVATTHNLSANLSWTGAWGQFSTGPFWRRTNDGFERITTVDASGISTTTWANLTSRTDLGASVSWGPPPVQGWRVRLNGNASRSVLSGSPRPEANLGGSVRWSVGGSLEGAILGPLNAQTSFGYQPPRDLAQGRTSGQWRADMGFRYRMLDNRTTISLSVQDPFALRRTSQELRDPSVIQVGSSRVPTRAMSVSASYTFGRSGRGGPGR